LSNDYYFYDLLFNDDDIMTMMMMHSVIQWLERLWKERKIINAFSLEGKKRERTTKECMLLCPFDVYELQCGTSG
jgi:hypothetical protein